MARSPEAARSASGRRGSPWRAAGLFLAVLVTLTGAGLVGLAALAPEPVGPPQPDLAAAPPALPSPLADPPTTAEPTPSEAAASPSTSVTPGDAAGALQPLAVVPSPIPITVGMPRSQPTRVRVPRVGIDAPTVALGLDRNQQIAVPPLKQPKTAGWYKLGPSPGEIGTAVLVGHVDSRVSGRAVFYQLGALKPGDTVVVLRADGTTARFTVDGVARYPKKKLPLGPVYGHTGKAQLRLITCGGAYDKKAKSYKDNIVVFATLAT